MADEYQWMQPINQYYHWESNEHSAGRSHSGEFYNGICMYNWHPCEYLHIKLSEPLEKDSTYHMGLWYRIASFKAKGHEMFYKLGAQLTDKRINTTRRFVINEIPQILLQLPDTTNKLDWNFTENTFVAKGNEEYLTLGYFPGLYFSKEEMTEYVAPTDSSIIALAESSQGKKKKKKKNKFKEKDLAEFRRMINQKTKSESGSPRSNQSNGRFTLRYYFDDICLSKINSKGIFNCDIDEEASYAKVTKDQTFRLNRVYFSSGEATLIDSSFYELDRLAFFLEFKPEVRINIIGHTDDIGKENENLKLSEKRAESVRNYLVQKGLEEIRISYEGKGESEPKTGNDTAQGRQINRRVEFKIVQF